MLWKNLLKDHRFKTSGFNAPNAPAIYPIILGSIPISVKVAPKHLTTQLKCFSYKLRCLWASLISFP